MSDHEDALNHYRNLSLSGIVDDLDETLSDLYINAGVNELGALVKKLNTLPSIPDSPPTARLIELMALICEHGLRLPAPFALLDEAVQEICALTSPAL